MFRNGLQYRDSDFKTFICDDLAISCKNVMNCGLVTPEFKKVNYFYLFACCQLPISVQVVVNVNGIAVRLKPKVNHNEWRLLYFISFLLLVAFFVLNMFVGVVVENFHKCREKQEQEEKARRAATRARKLDRKRKRPSRVSFDDL